MYPIRTLKEPERELAHLDKAVGRLIVRRIQPEALTGDLSGLYKSRDYRVVSEIVHAKATIVIHAIGHRSEVYRRR